MALRGGEIQHGWHPRERRREHTIYSSSSLVKKEADLRSWLGFSRVLASAWQPWDVTQGETSAA